MQVSSLASGPEDTKPCREGEGEGSSGVSGGFRGGFQRVSTVAGGFLPY